MYKIKSYEKLKSIRSKVFKNPKYANIFKRLDTFEKRSWPPGIPQKPRELADAGFYYTGTFFIYDLTVLLLYYS